MILILRDSECTTALTITISQISMNVYATILLLVIFAKDYFLATSVYRNHNSTIDSDLSAQAFCLQPHPSQIFDRYFPLHYPEAHLPWYFNIRCCSSL